MQGNHAFPVLHLALILRPRSLFDFLLQPSTGELTVINHVHKICPGQQVPSQSSLKSEGTVSPALTGFGSSSSDLSLQALAARAECPRDLILPGDCHLKITRVRTWGCVPWELLLRVEPGFPVAAQPQALPLVSGGAWVPLELMKWRSTRTVYKPCTQHLAALCFLQAPRQ